MNRLLFLALCVMLLFWACKKNVSGTNVEEPQPKTLSIRGADLSLLGMVRNTGLQFKNEAGNNEDMLLSLKNSGMNLVRLRLWKNSSDPFAGYANVKTLAQEVKSQGLKLLLTPHFSDTWADPGKQTKPAQWTGKSIAQLKDSVYAYTKNLVLDMQPDYIQIGNEINAGFLWPEGNISNPAQMKELLASGIKAVRDHRPATKIILHYAGHAQAPAFFAALASLDYDIAALSFYPIWHGKSLVELKQSVRNIVSQQNKEVLIVETAYPFTLGWNDWTNNILGENGQIMGQFPASPLGQKGFLDEMKKQLLEEPKALGFVYWGGEWVSLFGPAATNGSSWENQALWDFSQRLLPAAGSFKAGL